MLSGSRRFLGATSDLGGVAALAILIASGIGSGALLGINQVGWAFIGAAGGCLVGVALGGTRDIRAALRISASYVGLMGVTSILLWSGPWAASPVSTSPAPGFALQGMVILVLLVVAFGAATTGATIALGLQWVGRAAK